MANGQIEWSQSTSFNRIKDGAWLKSGCVKNLKLRNVNNFDLLSFYLF